MSQVSAVRDRAVTANDGVANPVPINYPDLVEAGDVLLLMAVVQSNSVAATGWTSLGAETFGRGGEMFWRTADGSEGGTTFDISQATSGADSVAIVWSIRADLNPGTPEATSVQHNVGTDDWDPPSLSPSGGDRLYQWFVAGYLDSNIALTSWDSTLDERIQQTSISGVLMGAVGAERLLSAATFDPGPSTKSGSQEWGAWTVAVPVDQPANGNFPVVETTSQGSWASSSTTQTLTLPTGVAVGDLLTATIASAQSITVSIAGWDELATEIEGTQTRGTILQRVADGTEGATVTVDFSSSGQGTYVSRRISGADGTKSEAAALGSTLLYPDWPSLTPAAGADDILWIADLVNDSTRFLVGWPVNYGAVPLTEQDGNIGSDSAAGGVLARNQATADPANGRTNNTIQAVAITAAIYPTAAPPPPPPSGSNRMGGTGAIRKPPRTPR